MYLKAKDCYVDEIPNVTYIKIVWRLLRRPNILNVDFVDINTFCYSSFISKINYDNEVFTYLSSDILLITFTISFYQEVHYSFLI